MRKQYIATILTQLQKGEITLQQATHRLLAEQTRKSKKQPAFENSLRCPAEGAESRQGPRTEE